MNYLEMQKEFARCRRGATRKRNGGAGPSRGGAALSPVVKSASRGRAFDAVNHRVPGIVPPVRQPSGMTCWATVTTMMLSWKLDQSLTIQTALAQIGQEWLDKFNNDQGLSGVDKPRFLATAGLIAEPPMSYSIEGWLQMLRNYGPLWVTTDEDPSAAFAIHARILAGISGDGTPGGTQLLIVDPGTGSEYTEGFETFVRKFEEEARTTAPLRVQVVHWPPNARGTAQSLSRLKPQPQRRPIRAWAREADRALAWGARVSEAFRARVREICGNLGCDASLYVTAAGRLGDRRVSRAGPWALAQPGLPCGHR